MFSWFYELFSPTTLPSVTQSIIVILLAISIGFFIGKLKIFNVSLGVAAVLFIGIILGHYGYRIEEPILHFCRDFGLILFVYGIGLQVGPSFFSSLKNDGIKLNFLAISAVLFGGVITYIIYKIVPTTIEHAVGLMSGAVTNTPGLGAAKSTLAEIQSALPTKKITDPTIAYAIAYPLGVIGIILSITLSKFFLRIDVKKEIKFVNIKKSKLEKPIVHKKCRVTNEELFGLSIYEIFRKLNAKDIIVSRLKNSGSHIVYSPSLDTKIQRKDVLMLVGTVENINKFIELSGKVSTDIFIESEEDVVTKNLFVTKSSATHKKLSELDLYNKFNLKVTRVFRSGMELLAQPSLELFYGDKVRIVGTKEAVLEAEKIIGNSEKRLLEPDFLSLFGGLILGIMVGSIPILLPTLPVPIKLGFAAGPLIVALLISRFGGVGAIHSYINNGAIYFMKDLGICMFFASVGVHAGENFYENFVLYNGWKWLFYACFITFIPLLYLILVGRYYLKLSFFQLVGLMSGTYTDPAALAFGTKFLDSELPIQTYATVYPLVTIFRIFVAQILILLFV